MSCAEIIALEEVRARKQWDTLRQQLHTRFEQWLDVLEARVQKPVPTLADVTATVGALRQQLTGGVAETIVHHTPHEERQRQHIPCPTCARLLPARGPVHRCVETMVGAVELGRPSFYCQRCRRGCSPLDDVLEVSAGRLQRDVQQAAASLVTEVPYATAAALCGDLSGIALRSERMHTRTNHVAEGLTVLDVAPSREEIARRVAAVAADRFRRPVVVRGIDGAYVPTRPASAREPREGQRHTRAKRARWRGQGRDAKGVRLSLLDGDRIVHLLRWHQVQTEEQRGEALAQSKKAGVSPKAHVRLCVGADGAAWIWKHVQALFPQAPQVLDYSHCSESLHKVAKVQYGQTCQAVEWVEATFTRLDRGKRGTVLGGLRRMQPTSDEARKAMDKCWVSLNDHRRRTHDRTLRRGG